MGRDLSLACIGVRSSVGVALDYGSPAERFGRSRFRPLRSVSVAWLVRRQSPFTPGRCKKRLEGSDAQLDQPAVDAADAPLPGRTLGRREVVVIATGQGLERDQGGVVLEQDPGAGGGVDIGLRRSANVALPAQPGPVEPVGHLDPAEVLATVIDRDEGGRALTGRRLRGGPRRPRSSPAGSGGSRPGPGAGRRGRARRPGPAPGRGQGARAASRRRGPEGGGGRARAGAGRRRSSVRGLGQACGRRRHRRRRRPRRLPRPGAARAGRRGRPARRSPTRLPARRAAPVALLAIHFSKVGRPGAPVARRRSRVRFCFHSSYGGKSVQPLRRPG